MGGGGVNDLMGGGVKRREKERDPILRKMSMFTTPDSPGRKLCSIFGYLTYMYAVQCCHRFYL